LDPPRKYEFEWSDKKMMIWRPICNEGYVALGDLCTLRPLKGFVTTPSTSRWFTGSPPRRQNKDKRSSQPDKNHQGNFKCVQKHLTKPCGKTKIVRNFESTLFQSNDELVQGVLLIRHRGEDRQPYCLNDVVEAKICGKDEYKVTLTVTTRFRQNSLVEISKYEEKTRSSKSFRKKLEEMSKHMSKQSSEQLSKQKSGNFGLGLKLFSFNAGGSTATSTAAANAAASAFSSLADSIENNEEGSKFVSANKKIFNEGSNQIFQETETQINIDGSTATMTKTVYFSTAPKDEPWSSDKLREEAEKHMEYEFGSKGVNKNRYTDTVCIKK